MAKMQSSDADPALGEGTAEGLGDGRTALWAGAAAVVLFNVLAGANEVFVGNRLQVLDPALLLLVSNGIAAVFFNCLQVRRPGDYLRRLRRDWRLVAMLNVVMAVNWISFFVALKFAEPAIVATANVAVGPAMTIVLARWLRPGSSVLGVERIAAAGILVLLAVGVYLSAIGQSGVGSTFHELSAVGVGASIVCGIAIVIGALFAKRLYDAGWRASQVMASRFWVLIAASGIAVALEPSGQRGMAGLAAVGVAALVVAVVGTMLSIYVLQLGIQRLEPVTLSLVLAGGAIFTLAIQAFDPRLRFSAASTAVVVLSAVLVAWSVVARDRAERRVRA